MNSLSGLGSRHYRFAALCFLFFVAVQIFQELALAFWIPEAKDPEQELMVYLSVVDRVRSLLILLSIVLLIVPYSVIALHYFQRTPLAALVGFVGALGFIGFELLHRSIDYFVVGRQWAMAFHASGDNSVRQHILALYTTWGGFARGLYFPLMLSYMGSSVAFLYATMRHTGVWARLASFAFGLNALRLLARLVSTYGGATWLDPINNTAYFPFVFVINALLAAWLLRQAALRHRTHA